MPREPYHREKEHQVIGTYPPVRGCMVEGEPIRESPRLYRPISPRENYRMLFQGKTPYWIPHSGWWYCDVNEFRPRQHPDNLGNHQAIDGGGPIDYQALGDVIPGWFDLPLEWNEATGGATVHPDSALLEDLSDWESVISMPDLDALNWAEMAEMNREFLDTDKPNQLGIQFGLWERMMNLMGVENAAVALLDEDQEEGVHRFLDRLSDVYIDYIGRVLKVGPIDSVMLHDDWGTQNGPFFSLETCCTFFVPPMKKIVEFCHQNGIIFEHHCCGKAEQLVPAMLECGTDYWFPQPAVNDIDMLIRTYRDKPITFAVASPVLPKGSTSEEIGAIAKEWVERYRDAGILMTQNFTIRDENHDPALFPTFADAVYEHSRIAYQNEQ